MTVAPAKTYGALLVCDLIVAAGVAMLINALAKSSAYHRPPNMKMASPATSVASQLISLH
ncbi:MAG: hypothetical protein ACF8QF_14495, partial [Phycisphaerales bacterium]